jgi:hypothetical protein
VHFKTIVLDRIVFVSSLLRHGFYAFRGISLPIFSRIGLLFHDIAFEGLLGHAIQKETCGFLELSL